MEFFHAGQMLVENVCLEAFPKNAKIEIESGKKITNIVCAVTGAGHRLRHGRVRVLHGA